MKRTQSHKWIAIPFIGNIFIYTNLCNISWFVSIPIQLKLRWFVKSSYWLEVFIKIKSNRNQSSKKITSSWQRFCLFREWLHHHIFLQLYKILYNYSLLLRSIRIFMDLKIDIHQRLRWILISKVHNNSYWQIQKTVIVLLH